MTLTRRPVTLLTAAAIALLFGSPARAALIHWINPAGGDFVAAANWDVASPPTASDVGNFDLSATYVVDFADDATVGGLSVTDGTVSFNLTALEPVVGSDGRIEYILTDQTLTVGQFAFVGNDAAGQSAELKILGGTVNGNDGVVALGLNSTGSVTVSGVAAAWDNERDLRVGNGGDGTLRIEAGAQANNVIGYIAAGQASTSTATVTGNDSIWRNSQQLYVGQAGDGTLNVEQGGAVESAGAFIAHEADSTGLAVVTGEDSVWSTGNGFSVGHLGSGTLRVEQGGVVNSVGAFIAHDTDSTGLAAVTGDSSVWNAGSDLSVGSAGNGTLNISDGGRVTSQDGVIGEMAGATGVVTVNQPGSNAPSTWDNAGTLTIGKGGSGVLHVINGGQVMSHGDAVIGDLGAAGEVTVQGRGLKQTSFINSDWTNDGDLYVGKSNGENSLTIVGDGSGLGFGVVKPSDFITEVSNHNAYIGFGAGAKGTVTVKEGGLWNNQGDLIIGLQFPGVPQEGILNIETKALVWVDDDIALGTQGTINLAGGFLRLDRIFISDGGKINYTSGGVQLAGSRRLLIDSVVENFFPTNTITAGKSLRIEEDARLQGTFTIDGGRLEAYTPSSTATIGSIRVETGTLEILNGGTADSPYYYIGGLPNRSGVINVTGTGSEITAGSAIEVGGPGTGTINIDQGGHIFARHATLGANGTINVGEDSSMLAGPLTIETGGTLTIGPGSVVTQFGGYVQSVGSLLRYLIDGVASDDGVGLLDIQGFGELGGTLEVVLTGGFVPSAGDQFNLFDVGSSFSGTFANVELAPLPNGLQWDDSNLYVNGTLSVVPEPTSLALFAACIISLVAAGRTSAPASSPTYSPDRG